MREEREGVDFLSIGLVVRKKMKERKESEEKKKERKKKTPPPHRRERLDRGELEQGLSGVVQRVDGRRGQRGGVEDDGREHRGEQGVDGSRLRGLLLLAAAAAAAEFLAAVAVAVAVAASFAFVLALAVEAGHQAHRGHLRGDRVRVSVVYGYDDAGEAAAAGSAEGFDLKSFFFF